MRRTKTVVYQSKRDWWIVALIWAGALLCLFAAVTQLFGNAAPVHKAAFLLVLSLAAAFMLWMLYSIDYRLTAEHLLIRCGPFRYRVPLAAIDSVEPSRNPLSSPAGSLDRMLIKWNTERKRILISPERKKEFLRDLDKRCEQLKLMGERLTRIKAADA